MTRRSWLLMGLLAALWGASYLFIKVAIEDGVAPLFVVFARIALGTAVLVVIARRSGALRAMRGRTGPVVVIALVQVVVPFALIAYGERHVASSMAGILVSSAPIFTALLAARLDADERPRGLALVGSALGLAGVVLLLGVDLGGDAAAIAGGLMILLASVGYAVGAVLVKARLAGAPAVGVATATMLAGTIALLPLAVLLAPERPPASVTVLALVALGAGGTGIAFAIFYTLIAEIGPSRASLVAYLAPGFAVVYGVALLGESITAGTIAGLGLILAGSWLAAERRLPGRPRVAASAREAPAAERP